MTDELPPTQYLVMEVLAARYRLGESHWTFPTSCLPAIEKLADLNYVWHKIGITEKTTRVWLTDVGKTAWSLDKPYLASGGHIQSGGAPITEGCCLLFIPEALSFKEDTHSTLEDEVRRLVQEPVDLPQPNEPSMNLLVAERSGLLDLLHRAADEHDTVTVGGAIPQRLRNWLDRRKNNAH